MPVVKAKLLNIIMRPLQSHCFLLFLLVTTNIYILPLGVRLSKPHTGTAGFILFYLFKHVFILDTIKTCPNVHSHSFGGGVINAQDAERHSQRRALKGSDRTCFWPFTAVHSSDILSYCLLISAPRWVHVPPPPPTNHSVPALPNIGAEP